MNEDRTHNTDSVYAFQRIPHTDEKGRAALEAVAGTWFKNIETAKRARVLQYFENASYLLGNHLTRYYHTADGGFGFHTFGVTDKNQFDHLVAKVADNHLVRPVETVIGMLTDIQPTARVEPNSELPEDEDAAKLSETTIRLFFEKPLNMPEKLRESVLVAATCGKVACEIEYAETGEYVEVPTYKVEEQDNPLFDDDAGEPRKVSVRVPSGSKSVARKDLRARIWTPFHMIYDPTATTPEELKWLGRVTFEDVDWIKEQFSGEGKTEANGYYPDALNGLKAQDGTGASLWNLYWWSKVQEIQETPHHPASTGAAASTFAGYGGFAPNQVPFVVLDVKPCEDYPKGRTLIFAAGKLVYCGVARAWSQKYPWRWHPYAFFDWFKMAGRMDGVALLSLIVPHQKKINAIDALVQANRQYMSIGQWLIPKHSKMREGAFSGIPGEQYQYVDVPGMSKPEKVRNVPLDAALLEEKAQLIAGIEGLAASGVTDMQIAKSAARAGVMLDFLRQEKLRSKSPMIHSFERYIEAIAQNVLIEIQLNLMDEDPELTERIRRAGRDLSLSAVESFTGSSLRDHHAVTIDIASELMHSPEAKQAKALEAAQYLGAQMGPVQLNAVFKAVGLDEFMVDEQNKSIDRARRMVSRIISGQLEYVLPMRRIDIASVMAPVFQREIQSDRFMDHPEEIKGKLVEMFDFYMDEVQREAAEARQQQLQWIQAVTAAGGKAPTE